MPTYEYECRKCGHLFEVFQSMTDPHRRFCPKCRGRVDRLIGAGAGIIFKGSGFHTTDYRSDSYKQAAKKEKAEPADKAPSGEKADPSSGKKPVKKKDSK